jgi:predicted Rossmann-fold nucleotide-binding protein
MLRRVVVLARASELASPDELAAAQRVARRLAETGITVVCTGEALGPVGTVARVALEAGGTVVGVVLAHLADELVQPGLSERRSVADAAGQRGELLALGDATLALPGAFPGLAEVFGFQSSDPARERPIGLLDEGAYYSTLLGAADDQALEQFIKHSQRGAVTLGRDLDELLLRLGEFRPPETRRGISSP